MITGRSLALNFIFLFISFSFLLAQEERGLLQADTVRAKALLEEGEVLRKNGRYSEALSRANNSLKILKNIRGDSSLIVANILFQIGGILRDSQQFEQSILKYNTALKIYWKLYGVNSKYMGNCYNELAYIYLQKKDIENALNFQLKALEIYLIHFDNHSIKVGDAYFNVGNKYFLKNEFNSAIEFYKKALEVYINVYGKFHDEVANVYYSIGNSYINIPEIDFDEEVILKNSNEAIYYLTESLKINEKSKKNNCSDNFRNYYAIGHAYRSKEDYNKAMMYFKKAINFCSNHQENQINFEDSYFFIGQIYREQGDFVNAEKFLLEAATLHIKKSGKYSYGLANTFNDLGILYFDEGNYERALKYYLRYLEIIHYLFGDDELELAIGYNNIGNVYDKRGEYLKAISLYQKAQKSWSFHYGEKHPYIAGANCNLGEVYLHMGDYDNAIQFLKKAQNLWLETLGKNHIWLALPHNALGIAFRHKKEYNKSIDNLKKAIEISETNYGKTHREIAVAYINLSHTFYDMGEYQQSLKAAQNALSSSRFHLLKSDQSTNFKQGLEAINLLLKNNNTIFKTNDTLDYLLDALNLYNNINYPFFENRLIKILSQRENEYLIKASTDIYYNAILLKYLLFQKLNAQHYLTESFHHSERSKSLLLYQSLQESNALHFAGIPDSLLEQEYDLRVDITYYDKKRQGKLSEGLAETDTAVLAVSSKLFDLNQAYDSLKTRFEEEYPNYYQLKYDLSTISVEEVQKELLEPDQALIEYFVGDSSIFIFVVTPEDYAIHEVKRDFPLKEWVEQMQQNISQPHPYTLPAYAEAATNLYQKLIASIPDSLPNRLIIIPDGILGYIPFEALLTEAPTDPYVPADFSYLLHKKQISYSYSATLLREMQQKKHRQAPAREVLALAPYAEVDTVLTSHLHQGDWLATLKRDTLTPLPGSRLELDSIQTIMPTDAFYGEKATEQLFIDSASYYRILHLSTHGKADARVGDYSYLAFYPKPDSLENELLYVRDLYNLQLNADLVVLSACETGTGELQRGEGIISLARAFAYAGAKSIATTLWKVSDQSTQEIMVLFYRHLKNGLSKDQALQQAKRDYLNKQHADTNAHPFFWAAIIGIGDMRPIQ